MVLEFILLGMVIFIMSMIFLLGAVPLKNSYNANYIWLYYGSRGYVNFNYASIMYGSVSESLQCG